MSASNHHEHVVAPFDDSVSFDELPDAPPSTAYRPSITGWIGIAVTLFWFCGPQGLADSLRRDLRRQGMPLRLFHQEAFRMR